MAESQMKRFVTKEGGWMDQDGSVLKWVPGTSNYAGVWTETWNIGTPKRSAFGVQMDLNESLRF